MIKKTLIFVLIFSLNANAAKFCWATIKSAVSNSLDVAGDAATKLAEDAKAKTKAAIKMTWIDWNSIEAVKKQVEDLLEESKRQCMKAGGASLRFCGHTALSIAPIAYRVFKFEPTTENLREEIILPLSRMLIKMKSKEIKESELEVTYFEFLLFWPELLLKVQKALPSVAVEVSFDAFTGLITTKETTHPGALSVLKSEIRNQILKKFWQNLKTNDKNENLSYSERLKFATEEALKWDQADFQQLAQDIMIELGLDQLQAAISLYSKIE
ncbi:MAG: hypothetical protein ACK5V3_18595 [Bdellovibrionales bacterium]